MKAFERRAKTPKQRITQMMIEEVSGIERKLRRLEVARIVVGIAVIAAALAVALTGVVALGEERDAWLAMRFPLCIAGLLTWSFARIARAIVTLKGGSDK